MNPSLPLKFCIWPCFTSWLFSQSEHKIFYFSLKFNVEDLIYGPWTFWSSCDKDCGYGTMSRYRTCLNESQECDVEETKQEMNCNEFPCQIDGSKYQNLSWPNAIPAQDQKVLLNFLDDLSVVKFHKAFHYKGKQDSVTV